METELIFTDSFIQMFQITIIYVLVAMLMRNNYLINGLFIGLGFLFILNLINELVTNGFNLDVVMFVIFNMMVIVYLAMKTVFGSREQGD
jgi:hypothetical protein